CVPLSRPSPRTACPYICANCVSRGGQQVATGKYAYPSLRSCSPGSYFPPGLGFCLHHWLCRPLFPLIVGAETTRGGPGRADRTWARPTGAAIVAHNGGRPPHRRRTLLRGESRSRREEGKTRGFDGGRTAPAPGCTRSRGVSTSRCFSSSAGVGIGCGRPRSKRQMFHLGRGLAANIVDVLHRPFGVQEPVDQLGGVTEGVGEPVRRL